MIKKRNKGIKGVYIGILLGIMGVEMLYQGEIIDNDPVVNSHIEVDVDLHNAKIDTYKSIEQKDEFEIVVKAAQDKRLGSYWLVFSILGMGSIGHGIFLYNMDNKNT